MRRVLTSVAVAGALLAGPATASAQRAEPVAGLPGVAESLVRGPDDALWASLATDPGRIARVTTEGAVTTEAVGGLGGLPANRGPAGLTRHAGALWFALTGGPFARLEPGAGTTVFTLAAGRPTAFASGPDGALWMTVDGGAQPDAIVRWTAGSGETVFPLGADVHPRAIVSGPEGALWFIEDGRIGRITPDGRLTYRSVGATPSALAPGPDGALWYAQDRVVHRLDDPTPYPVGEPVSALAAGPDGALWAAVKGGLVRIVPGREPATFTDGFEPEAFGRALAAGPDGRLWLTLDRAPHLLRVTLPAAPVLPPQPTPTATPAPTPAGAIEGKSVEVRVLSGVVEFRVPPETDYRRVTGRATLPLGVLLDTESGKAGLTSVVDGRPQSGAFTGGKFTVTQTRTGMTELALAGPLSCPRGKASAAQKKKAKKKRLVWGSDAGGAYRTRGNGAVATVRGTEWRTEDTCRGTTVYVREGAVSVWPRRGGKSKLVRAGQRLFSPRPR